jgi:antitoxin FitA
LTASWKNNFHPGRTSQVHALHGAADCGPPASEPVSDRRARLRYYSAMATIQVREVPEELYEVLRRRARRAGQSMQAYMRDQLIAIAERPTKEEAIEEIEAIVGRNHGQEPTGASVIEDLAAERR